jgi:DnaK suppressor protein
VGGVIEIAEGGFVDRDAQFGDWVADAVGIGLAILIYALVRTRFSRTPPNGTNQSLPARDPRLNDVTSRTPSAIAGGTDDGEIAGFQEPANLAAELNLDNLDEAVAADIQERLEALERAEQRLATGAYGLSIESGEPIPDERLEAFPTAERTVEEESALTEHRDP